MLRSIGSVTFLALLMVGCGGGGGGGDSSSATPPPPPPPPPAIYTVGGTVSGLVGSGLTLATCTPPGGGGPGLHVPSCPRPLQVGANGAFTLDSTYPAGYSGRDFVVITQQPSSPTQHCVIGNAAVSIQNANDTSVTVSCAEYSYVTNAADNTLSSYSVDATTGALAAVGTPTATGTSPHAIVGLEYSVVEDKKYVYVGNEVSNDVSAFAVNPATGSLTTVPGSPFPAGTDPQAMTLSGPTLFVANAGSDNVSAYFIDPETGGLGAPSTIATGKGPTSIAVHPNYGFVYVANHGGSNDISAFTTNVSQMPDGSFHLDNMTPVLGSPFPAHGNPLSLAIGAGKFLYSANPDATNPSISGFSIDPTTGALSPLSGSPFPLPVSHYMATDQTGAYLYVTAGANIVGYAIDATTGALTALPGFPVSAGADAYSVSIDPTNRFLYVANHGAANIAGFRLDASSSALTPISGSPFQAGSRSEFIATF
jgi:6-phosphogluconolactonase